MNFSGKKYMERYNVCESVRLCAAREEMMAIKVMLSLLKKKFVVAAKNERRRKQKLK